MMNSRDPFALDTLTMRKAFASIEQEGIIKALRPIGINEIYITVLDDICLETIARVHNG